MQRRLHSKKQKFMIKALAELLASPGPKAINAVPWPAELAVLVLAPHPDDFDAIAVTLKFLHERGASINAAVARTSSGVEDSYRPGTAQAEKTAIREQEQRESLKAFGLPAERATFFSFDNDATDQLSDTPRNRALIKTIIEEKMPDIVFLPHGNDSNPAHKAMYAMFCNAAAHSTRSLGAFLNRDPKTSSMQIDFYTPFGPETAEWKAGLLRIHASQHHRNIVTRGRGFDERILELNRKTARELALNTPYAEAFEVELFRASKKEASQNT